MHARTSVLTLLLAGLAAQVPTDPAVLRQRLDDKLAAPFLRLHDWHHDLAGAQAAAAREGKLILVHCTRSFVPCGTSIRCEREVLSAPEFAALAQRVVLYCHVSAHVDATTDRFLFRTRGSGWPHHVVLDASGRVLGTHESHREKSVAELAALVDRAQAWLQVEAATAREIAAANLRRLRAGLDAGALELTEARRLFANSGTLAPAEAEHLAGMLTDLEIGEVLAGADRFDDAKKPGIAAAMHGLWRLGKRPSARNPSRDFWGGILLHLEKAEKPDLELYRDALGRLEAMFGEARGYRAFLDERKKALAGLQAKALAAPPNHD